VCLPEARHYRAVVAAAIAFADMLAASAMGAERARCGLGQQLERSSGASHGGQIDPNRRHRTQPYTVDTIVQLRGNTWCSASHGGVAPLAAQF